MAVKVNTQAVSGEADDCKIGYSCGLACISQNKICLKNLSPEQTRILLRMRDLIISGRKGVNPDGSGSTKLDKSFDKLVGALTERVNNLNRAQEMEKIACGKNGDPDSCKKAKASSELAAKHLKDTEVNLQVLQRGLEIEKRSTFKKAEDLLLPEGYIDNMKENHDKNVKLQRDVNEAAKQYQDEWEEIQKRNVSAEDRNKLEKELFKRYDDKLTDIYNEAEIAPLNDKYIDKDTIDAAYDLLPTSIQNYMKKAGAISNNLGVAKLEHGDSDFENGYYTGEKGKVVNQKREGTYVDKDGVIQKTDKDGPSGVDRGKAVLEIYMRGEGSNIWSDTFVNLSKMELEHLTDWKNNKRHTDNWGNLGSMERAGNGWKGNQSMEEWGNGSNGYLNTTTEERNKAARERSAKRSGSDEKAQSLFDKDGKPKFSETVSNNVDTDDELARKIIKAYNKGKPLDQNIYWANVRELVRNQTDPQINLLAAKNYIGNADVARKIFVNDPTVENPRYQRPASGEGRAGSMAYKTSGMNLAATLTVGGVNISTQDGRTISEIGKKSYETAIKQAKDAERITKDTQGKDLIKAQLERERKPTERFDARFKSELEKELQGTEYSVDDLMELTGIKI